MVKMYPNRKYDTVQPLLSRSMDLAKFTSCLLIDLNHIQIRHDLSKGDAYEYFVSIRYKDTFESLVVCLKDDGYFLTLGYLCLTTSREVRQRSPLHY